MLTYEELRKSPRKFLSMTSLKVEEFDILLPFFAEEYATTHSATHTRTGQAHQRKTGGGNKPRLATIEDKLLFILVYKKTYPLQTAHDLMCGMGQLQANEWIHRLSPTLAPHCGSGCLPGSAGRKNVSCKRSIYTRFLTYLCLA